MLPHRIGRYDISAELGRGATSIVYKGVDPVDGRVVAIKTLQRSGAGGDEDADSILQRFRDEARTIADLRHPGVVAVDEFEEDGLHTWIAMAYVAGANLDDVLLRDPLPGQHRALAILDELLDALGCVHHQGICHRDVKPENIMVTPAGRVKLTDFGVAGLRDLGLTRVSSVIGTPAFMAPEQFTGGTLDHRADLFACGVLAFLLLSGRRPFSGSPAAVMHQILHAEPPLLSEAGGGLIGREYDDVIARALAKRPENRFSTAEEMRDALRDAALQAADSPLATVVGTMVQDAGHAPSDRASMHPGEPVPRVIVSGARDLARLVDAFALYTPEHDKPQPSFDGLPSREADASRVTSIASSVDALPPEIFAAVQHLLTHTLGPVAGVLVKRAADAASDSRPAFIANLLEEVAAPGRATLRAELEALVYQPQRVASGR